jgi:hypothetical protein
MLMNILGFVLEITIRRVTIKIREQMIISRVLAEGIDLGLGLVFVKGFLWVMRSMVRRAMWLLDLGRGFRVRSKTFLIS